MILHTIVICLDVYLQNLIEVPSLYHRQWAPDYPPYVLFDYNGDKHCIKLRKYYNRYYFADRLKDSRITKVEGDVTYIRICFDLPPPPSS